MAEYLVMADDHWTRKIPANDRENWSDSMWEKYFAAYEKGDVVAVYEDGTLSEVTNPRFKGVKVPGEQVDNNRQSIYATDNVNGVPGGGQFVQKRRFNIDIDALIPTGKRIVTVLKTELDTRIVDKKELMEGS